METNVLGRADHVEDRNHISLETLFDGLKTQTNYSRCLLPLSFPNQHQNQNLTSNTQPQRPMLCSGFGFVSVTLPPSFYNPHRVKTTLVTTTAANDSSPPPESIRHCRQSFSHSLFNMDLEFLPPIIFDVFIHSHVS